MRGRWCQWPGSVWPRPGAAGALKAWSRWRAPGWRTPGRHHSPLSAAQSSLTPEPESGSGNLSHWVTLSVAIPGINWWQMLYSLYWAPVRVLNGQTQIIRVMICAAVAACLWSNDKWYLHVPCISLSVPVSLAILSWSLPSINTFINHVVSVQATPGQLWPAVTSENLKTVTSDPHLNMTAHVPSKIEFNLRK